MALARSSQLAACLMFAMIGDISALQKDVPQTALATGAPEPEKNSVTAKPDQKPIDELNWVQHAPVKGNISKPRLIVSQGCENNELVIEHARTLLKIHGIHTPWRGALGVAAIGDLGIDNSSSSELSLGEFDETVASPDESGDEESGEGADDAEAASPDAFGEEEAEEEDSFRASVYQMHNLYHSKGKTMFLKGTIGKDNKAIFDKKLVKLGTVAVVVTRKNRIDQVVCMIKDCVNDTMGYPTENGNKSDMCWKRHKEETPEYKAYIRPAALAPTMVHLEQRSQSMKSQLKNNGYYKVSSFDSEDLLDFTFDKNAVGRGVSAWTHLLQAWRIRAMPALIKKYLEQKAGSRPRPSPHNESILNYQAVKESLGNHSRFAWMLRE